MRGQGMVHSQGTKTFPGGSWKDTKTPKGQQAACNHRANQPNPQTTHQTMLSIGAERALLRGHLCNPPPHTEASSAGLTGEAELWWN